MRRACRLRGVAWWGGRRCGRRHRCCQGNLQPVQQHGQLGGGQHTTTGQQQPQRHCTPSLTCDQDACLQRRLQHRLCARKGGSSGGCGCVAALLLLLPGCADAFTSASRCRGSFSSSAEGVGHPPLGRSIMANAGLVEVRARICPARSHGAATFAHAGQQVGQQVIVLRRRTEEKPGGVFFQIGCIARDGRPCAVSASALKTTQTSLRTLPASW